MISLGILAVIAILLWFAVFISRRRFGVLGLALVAGSTIGALWNYEAVLLVASLGLVPAGPVTDAVVLSIVTLLPAIVLFFGGSAHKSLFGRICGATLFVILAMTVLIEPIGIALPVAGPSATIFNFIREYAGAIMSVGVVVAVLDILIAKPHVSSDKASKRSKKK